MMLALQLDLHPGRPTPEMHRRLLEQEWGDTTVLVQFEDAFLEPESGLFHDSCHLTEQGYASVAATFFEAIIAQLGWGMPQ